MESESLRWGFLSTARINRALVEPLRTSKKNRLTAVASRSLEKAESYAREWGIPRAFGSYESMLNDPGIDIIYISLPNSMHAEWTIRALRAGKHVLCEKPLALSVEDVDAIKEATRETGKIVAEGFMFRHHPQTKKVRELVESGAIGELHVVRGAFTFKVPNPSNIRLHPELGGGSLWDVGCYPISYARTIAACEPEEVFGWQAVGETGAEVEFLGTLKFPGSIFCQFQSALRSARQAVMEVVGSEGKITIPDPFKPGKRYTLLLERGGETEKLHLKGADLYSGEVNDLAEAVLNGTPTLISLEDSRRNIAAIQALYCSAQTGQPVSM